ncbi:MAG: helix-turn-helix domain-containing protein [Myxococcaceae bacterium]
MRTAPKSTRHGNSTLEPRLGKPLGTDSRGYGCSPSLPYPKSFRGVAAHGRFQRPPDFTANGTVRSTKCGWPCGRGPGKATFGLPDFSGLYERLLTTRQVAERLAVSPATVYKLLSRGAMPHLRVSNAIRVRQADLDAYCTEHA